MGMKGGGVVKSKSWLCEWKLVPKSNNNFHSFCDGKRKKNKNNKNKNSFLFSPFSFNVAKLFEI